MAAWVAELRSEGLSASRVRQAAHLLGSILGEAVKNNMIARNAVEGIELPRLTSRPRRFLDHDQVARLAAASGDSDVIVLVLAYCGLRWGELAALRVRNLDLLRSRIDVDQAVSDVDGHLIVGAPKSHQARSVAVPRFLRDRLAEHVNGRGRDDLVFISPRGDMLRVNNWRRSVFDDAAASVGLVGFTPHELRHTAASLAIASGASVKAVQRALGHASATLTLDRYGQLFPDELDSVATALDQAVTRHVVPQARPAADVLPLDGSARSR